MTEARLKRMLSHEINLIEERIDRSRHPDIGVLAPPDDGGLDDGHRGGGDVLDL